MDVSGDGDQCMAAAVRPIEAKRLIVGRGKRRPTMFPVNQKNLRGPHPKIGREYAAQRIAATAWRAVDVPDVNLVIAQTVCYVGNCLKGRRSHPCMVPLPLSRYKRGARKQSGFREFGEGLFGEMPR